MTATQAKTTMPVAYAGGYSDDDKAMVVEILEYLESHAKTKAWLFSAARINKSTGSLVLSGKYGSDKNSPPTTHLKKMISTIRTYDERKTIVDIPWVETTTYRLAVAACNRARKYKTFAIFNGHVGVGKTSSLKEYTRKTENTLMIEADPNMSAGSLIDELIEATGVNINSSGKSVEKRYKALMNTLKGTDILIVLDEAENASDKALHYLRRLRDKCGIGIVLSGREELQGKIAPPVNRASGEFDQIHSRAGFMPATIRAITDEDADALVQAFFSELEEVDAEVLERFRYWAKGCARMLVENLLPTVRDYGMAKHELSPQLIDKVARQVLNLKGEK